MKSFQIEMFWPEADENIVGSLKPVRMTSFQNGVN